MVSVACYESRPNKTKTVWADVGTLLARLPIVKGLEISHMLLQFNVLPQKAFYLPGVESKLRREHTTVRFRRLRIDPQESTNFHWIA